MTASQKKTAEKIAKLKAQMRELQRLKPKGCLRWCEATNRWSFKWREDGEYKFKYFSVSKLGSVAKAKKAAEEYRTSLTAQ